MVAEQQGTQLTNAGGGLLGWLRRLVAGAEIAALEARVAQLTSEAEAAGRAAAEARDALRELEARHEGLSEVLAVARSKERELEERLASQPDIGLDDPEAAVAPLRLELDQRTREQAELEKTIAKKESERRDAAAKLAKVQSAHDALDKRLRDAEAKLKEAEARAKDADARAKQAERRASDASGQAQARSSESSRELTTLRETVDRLERRGAELEAALAASEKDRAAQLAARDEKIARLEQRLVEALAERDEAGLERALREREALVEELEIALAARQRMADASGP